jgi:hypothetical protein
MCNAEFSVSVMKECTVLLRVPDLTTSEMCGIYSVCLIQCSLELQVKPILGCERAALYRLQR